WFLKKIQEVNKARDEAQDKAQVEAHDEKPFLSKTELNILISCKDEILAKREILDKLGNKSLSGNIKKSFQKLIEKGLIEYTIPAKPNSRNQKYKITDKGIYVINQHKDITTVKESPFKI
ncbi:MAG: Fic family protein, partial [Candidatus Eremiobacterota bacterium]